MAENLVESSWSDLARDGLEGSVGAEFGKEAGALAACCGDCSNASCARRRGPADDAMTGTDPASVFDASQLQQYTMGDAALDREVLGLFRDSLDEIRATMGQAISVKEWRMAAHTLKGSARSVGAVLLALVAEDVEKREDCLVGGDAQGVVLAQIDGALAATVLSIDAYLAKLG